MFPTTIHSKEGEKNLNEFKASKKIPEEYKDLIINDKEILEKIEIEIFEFYQNIIETPKIPSYKFLSYKYLFKETTKIIINSKFILQLIKNGNKEEEIKKTILWFFVKNDLIKYIDGSSSIIENFMKNDKKYDFKIYKDNSQKNRMKVLEDEYFTTSKSQNISKKDICLKEAEERASRSLNK